MSEIKTLERVEVRKLWPNEAADFTPWLHKHPQILGDALGTELFPQEMEANVGRYSADLLFRGSSDELVVVENMFGATDHDHVGKLVTYAAGLDAAVAVLIAEEFRDEHSSAIDWLNRVSNGVAFFGVALEAWRIGDSGPAPRLRVDQKPDDWSRTMRPPPNQSPTAQLYRRFWGDFLPRLHRLQPQWQGVSTPSKKESMLFGSSRSDLLKYGAVFNSRGCRVEAYLDSQKVQPADVFDWLEGQRDAIDAAVGDDVKWDRIDGKGACRIAVHFPADIRVAEEDRWPELIDWAVDAMGAMKDAFDPVISAYPD